MIGKTVKGRYKIIKKIGGGGMAEVYKAIDFLLNREVAVKVLLQQYVHDNDFIKRFRREAQSIQSLSHKNVVSIYDVGDEEDIYFIIMEYVEGSTLKELIQEKGSLPTTEAIEITKKIASALDHAHKHNIIHRDIKPHNILIGKKGEVKVTDFGIARAVSQATITHTGSVLGSVHYLSPEQARGGYTDEKSDLYSLGIVLYEMVTGKLPFSGDSPISIALKHLQDSFIYPKEIDPNIPQSVENIVLKALVKDPTKRYSSAKEILHDLETALDSKRVNEPQFKIDEEDYYDQEKTMITPAFMDYGSEESTFITKSRSTKNRNLTRKLPLLFGIIIFLTASFFGTQYIKGKLVIPDVEIPLLEGKHIDEAIDELEAIEELEALTLNYRIENRYDNIVKEDYVIKQEPYQGSIVKATQEIILYVSSGKKKIAMPNVINLQQGQGTFVLDKQGFKNIEVIQSYDEDTPSGVIFKQEPSMDNLVIPDETKILLFVSRGKEKFEMPNLIGKTESEAKAILLTNGLTEGKTNYEYSLEQPEGKVYKQFPYEPGREVTIGDQVDLYISKGKPQEVKKVFGDIIVLYTGNEEVEISIIIRDSREKDILWIKETIDSPKPYDNIELLLNPNTSGTISVYINGKLYQTETVKYR